MTPLCDKHFSSHVEDRNVPLFLSTNQRVTAQVRKLTGETCQSACLLTGRFSHVARLRRHRAQTPSLDVDGFFCRCGQGYFSCSARRKSDSRARHSYSNFACYLLLWTVSAALQYLTNGRDSVSGSDFVRLAEVVVAQGPNGWLVAKHIAASVCLGDDGLGAVHAFARDPAITTDFISLFGR